MPYFLSPDKLKLHRDLYLKSRTAMWGSFVLIPIKRNIALQVGIPTSLLRLDFTAAQADILFKSRQAKASSVLLFK